MSPRQTRRPTPKFIQIGRKRASGQILGPLLFYFFSRTRLLKWPVGGILTHTISLYAQSCRQHWGVDRIPQNPQKGAWLGNSKPFRRKIKMLISSKLS